MKTETMLCVSLLFAAIMTSCASKTAYVYSDAWLKAQESMAHYEKVYTNGMNWPVITSSNEIVMREGTLIDAEIPSGKISIRAGQGFIRSYTWDGSTRSVSLWPRPQRWYGSFGIYFPGPGEHWKSNRGITRGVLDEGLLWFKTNKDAVDWLMNVQPLKNCVYSSTGLVVAWEKVPARKQINVDVWQLMIDGSKPTQLPGSHDDQVSLIQ